MTRVARVLIEAVMGGRDALSVIDEALTAGNWWVTEKGRIITLQEEHSDYIKYSGESHGLTIPSRKKMSGNDYINLAIASGWVRLLIIGGLGTNIQFDAGKATGAALKSVGTFLDRTLPPNYSRDIFVELTGKNRTLSPSRDSLVSALLMGRVPRG